MIKKGLSKLSRIGASAKRVGRLNICIPFSPSNDLVFDNETALKVIKSALENSGPGSDWYKTGNGELTALLNKHQYFTIMLMESEKFLIFVYRSDGSYHPNDLTKGLAAARGEAGGDPFYMPQSTITNSDETLRIITHLIENGFEQTKREFNLTKLRDIDFPDDYPMP